MNKLLFRKLLTAIILFLFALLPGISSAQESTQPVIEPTQTVRLEIEEKAFENEMDVFPLPDSTVLIYKRPYFGSFKEEHVFQRYSKDFQLLWTTSLILEDRPEFHQFYYAGKSLYLMYLDNVSYKFSTLKLNTQTGSNTLVNYNLKEHDLDTDIRLGHFKVLNNQIFIAAQTSRNSLVVHINEATKEIKTIPALYDQLNSLEEFHIDTLINRAEFILSESNGIKGRLQVKRFTQTGDLYSNTLIQPPFGRSLVSAQLTPGDSTTKLIIGTYTFRDTRYSQGFFTSHLANPGGSLQYIDFVQLKHFFDHLGKRAQSKITEKAERYKEQDKDLRHRYRLLMHNLVPWGSNYYLLAEVYNAQGNVNYNRWPGYYNRIYGLDRNFPYPNDMGRNPSENTEYRYSHAVLCAFDKEGKLLWDNSFVLKDVVRDELTQTTHYAFAGNKIVMVYPHEKEIRYKIVNRDSTSENDLSVPLAGATPEEKFTSLDSYSLVHWYGPHFLAFGFGRIKAPRSTGRETYFLNKVSFPISD